MEVFPGGSRHLEAFPGVRRAPVQQLGPGYAVLSRDADLPVPIDHELGASVLEGWRRGGGDERERLVSEAKVFKKDKTIWRVELETGWQELNIASNWQLSLLSTTRRIFHDMNWKQLPSPARPQWPDKAFYDPPFKTAVGASLARFYFGLINRDGNRCPW